MPQILTGKYYGFLAQQMFSQINTNAISAYVFVGHPSVWSVDTAPPAPVDDVQKTDFDYWRDLLGAKLVTGNDCAFVVPRKDWVSGTVYDQYDDVDTALGTRSYFVLDATSLPNRVYKCLWNNGGAVSTTAPSVIGTDLVPTTTADNYVWQYMYTIDSQTARTFLTNQWMPVLSDNAVQANALSNAGKLPLAVPLVITGAGSGYNAAAAIVTTLQGDGSGAVVSANGVLLTGGGGSRITLAAGGIGYT